MWFTPSSTARRSTRTAASWSRGGPNTPGPGSCMAPKPTRWTGRPAKGNVSMGAEPIGTIDRREGAARGHPGGMVAVDEVRAFAAGLERSYEAVVHGRLKLSVGQIVYAAFSKDGEWRGFGFPKEERDALVAGHPDRFALPRQS